MSFPAFFVENRGVHEERFQYYVEHGDGLVLFEADGVVLRSLDTSVPDVRIAFAGARKDVEVRGAEPRPTVVSYFSGPEPEWRRGLRTFGAIVYPELWPGIDLVFRGERGAVKYEFRIAPGADPSLVGLRYEGAKGLEIGEDGALSVRARGRVLRDPRPVAWQTLAGARRPVEARFAVRSAAACLVGFAVGAFDRDHELVIDPAMLIYCGYAGPSRNVLTDIAVDASGSAYLLGMDFDPKQARHDGIRVMKVSPDGRRLDHVTFINGAGPDTAQGIAVDAQGSVYVAGSTWSDETSFPVTVGPSLKLKKGIPPGFDGFILKLAPGGTNLVYCGYLGGNNLDWARAVAVDATGAAWVTGATYSLDMPVKGGPFLAGRGNGFTDAIVAKVSPDGRSLLVSGYLPGFWDDYGYDIAVDPRGDAYLCGVTVSNDFPVVVGPGRTWGGGINGFDGFVAKVDGRRGFLHYSGYVGGTGDDSPNGIAVDAAGCAYIAGSTYSDIRSFPTKVGPFLRGTPGFVAKVEASGAGYVYCGRIPDGGCTVAIDGAGNAYLAGTSARGKLPARNGPSSTYMGLIDAFVAKVPSSGIGLDWAGYIGGVSPDSANALAVDPFGSVYVIGSTMSNEQTFPVTVGPGRRYNGGPPPLSPYGAFVAKVAEPTLVPSGTGRVGSTLAWSLYAAGAAGLPYQAGTSLGSGPIWIGNRRLDLGLDGLLAVSVQGLWPHVFPGYRGLLDAKEKAAAAIRIPPLPALAGVRIHTAFIVLDPTAPQGVHAVSQAVRVSIQP